MSLPATATLKTLTHIAVDGNAAQAIVSVDTTRTDRLIVNTASEVYDLAYIDIMGTVPTPNRSCCYEFGQAGRIVHYTFFW